MLGKAIDFYIPDVQLESIRDAGLRLQRGGVGFYPSSGAPFVHMDVGSVRHWPRVPEAQLARIMCQGPDDPPRVQHPAAQKRRPGRDRRRLAQCARRGRGCRGRRRPARRARRVTASVAPQAPPQQTDRRLAAVPMPKSRPGAIRAAAEPQRRPVSASPPPPRSRCARRRVRSRVRKHAKRHARRRRLRPRRPVASTSPRPIRSRCPRRVRRRPRASSARSRRCLGERHHQRARLLAGPGREAERPVPPADIPEPAPPQSPKRRSPAASRAAAWRRGRCPTARAPSAGLCAGQRTASRSRPGQASKARVVAKLPTDKQRDTGTAPTAAPPSRPRVRRRPASRSASASTIRGCAR